MELKEIFKKATARPNLPYYSLLSSMLQRKVNAALSGITSPDVALREAQKEGREIVETYEE